MPGGSPRSATCPPRPPPATSCSPPSPSRTPLRRGRVAALAGGLPAFADAAALLDGGGRRRPRPRHARRRAPRRRPPAAAAGVPVLVEKPPAPDRAGAAALAALDPAPYVAFNRRFDPAIAALRAATPAGAEVAVAAEIAYRRGGWGAARRRRRRAARPRPAPRRPRPLDHRRRGDRACAGRASPPSAPSSTSSSAPRGPASGAPPTGRTTSASRSGTATARRVGRHRVGGPVAAVLGRLRPGPHPARRLAHRGARGVRPHRARRASIPCSAAPPTASR